MLRASDTFDDGYVYANVWNHDARWGEVPYTDSGKDKAEEAGHRL